MKIKEKIERIIKKYGNGRKVLIYNVPKKEFDSHYEKDNYIWMNNRNTNILLKEKPVKIMTSLDYNNLLSFKKDYFLLDYSRLTEFTSFIYCVNFEEFDFEKFYNEAKKNKQYDGVAFAKKLNMNLGDKVYLYFTHLPDGKSRIMAKGEVIDDGFHYNNSNDITSYTCKSISELEIDRKEQYENNMNIAIRIDVKNNIFDSKNVKLGANDLGIKLDRYNFARSLDEKKVIEIEKRISKCENDSKSFSYYRDNMRSVKCFFDEHKEDAKEAGLVFQYNHKSFEKENHNMHYELHHMIEQHNYRRDKSFNDIVYNDDNTIPLCLNCHARIHKGKLDDRKKMVKLIYEKSNIKKVLNKIPNSELVNIKDSNKKLGWLLKQYIGMK